MSAITPDTLVPPHVDAARVFAFDLFHDKRMADDVHEGLKTLHSEAPDIFYTPLNGGHWMITRHEDVSHVLRDYEHFTNAEMDIPKMGSRYVMIPLNLDPPEHTPYRTVLMRYFSPQVVKGMDQKLRDWARLHIEKVVADGRCDVAKVGTAFPVSVFLEMMGLPLERFDEFRSVVVEYFGLAPVEHRNKLRGWIFDLMQEAITERRAAPRADLISRLISEDVEGRKMTDEELKSICFLLFIAGLDTVANAISFSMNFLAKDQAMQAKLAAEPDAIRDFLEEALRRFSPVNGSRMVKTDFEYGGVFFKAGDMVCTSQPLAGLDERANPDPMRFDLTRKDRNHTAFSVGPHLCVGHYLARNEMRIFLEEWLERIPRFRPSPDVKPKPRAGKVMSIKRVEVEWDAAASLKRSA